MTLGNTNLVLISTGFSELRAKLLLPDMQASGLKFSITKLSVLAFVRIVMFVIGVSCDFDRGFSLLIHVPIFEVGWEQRRADAPES
jgi:hypothetical protein